MTQDFFGRCAMRAMLADVFRPRCNQWPGHRFRRRHDADIEADLSPAGQLDINLRQQCRVEESTVIDTVTAIDAVARAKRVKAVFCAGMSRL